MTSRSHTSIGRPTFVDEGTTSRRSQRRLAALACAIAVGHPAVVMAAASPQEVVTYADLDIGSDPGARALSGRVLAAAKRVCVRSGLGSGIDRVALYQACVADTYRDATQRIAASRPSGAFVLNVRRAPYRASLSPGTDRRPPLVLSRR